MQMTNFYNESHNHMFLNMLEFIPMDTIPFVMYAWN